VPSTLVLLVRHGLTAAVGVTLPGRVPGVHLTDEGRVQAETVAARLAKLPKIAGVYASPLERARETALPIARALGVAVRIERGLNELDMGEWSGISLKRVRRKPEWERVQRYPSGFRFPGGESFTEMQARMTSTIAALVARHPDETIVAVSHADPIKATVAHALGSALDLFQRIVIFPASVTAIRHYPGGPQVLTVNSADGDLAGLAR